MGDREGLEDGWGGAGNGIWNGKKLKIRLGKTKRGSRQECGR